MQKLSNIGCKSTAKGFSFEDSGWAYALYEWAGIPGTLVCGYLSDKVFRRLRDGYRTAGNDVECGET